LRNEVAHDERAHFHTAGRGGERGEKRPAFVNALDRPARRAGEEVIAHPDRIEPDRLGVPREGEDLGPGRNPPGPVGDRHGNSNAYPHFASQPSLALAKDRHPDGDDTASKNLRG
jgi:hypothetical protein